MDVRDPDPHDPDPRDPDPRDPGARVEVGLRAALADVAGLGPFFAASADPDEAVDPTWRPCRELYADPAVLTDRVDLVGRVLGTGQRRVAASIAFQGLAARLASPLLGVAAGHGLLPPWSPGSLHWRAAATGPWPLWESEPEAIRPDPGALPAAVAAALVEPHLAALVTATQAVAPVSPRVLWGNAASAVAAAGGRLARSRPAVAGRARAVVDAVLGTAPLAGAGRLSPAWSFRRRSCCLYYRIPGGGTCGDCVLDGRPRGGARGD